jgi:hypothetical protein
MKQGESETCEDELLPARASEEEIIMLSSRTRGRVSMSNVRLVIDIVNGRGDLNGTGAVVKGRGRCSKGEATSSATTACCACRKK